MLLSQERGLSRRIVRPFQMPCTSDDSAATQTTISGVTVRAATTAFATLTVGLTYCLLLLVLEILAFRFLPQTEDSTASSAIFKPVQQGWRIAKSAKPVRRVSNVKTVSIVNSSPASKLAFLS